MPNHEASAAAEGIAPFLSRDRCQVWALHRTTGEPFYLDVGQAEEMRTFANEHLRCPYPGCDQRLTTRGGTKRDHFLHQGGTPHPSGPESEFHLAAKAMLATWLRGQVPDGAEVREEQSVKDRGAEEGPGRHRRPDVMVTGRSGRRVAYEVEYKTWSVAGWEAKQADLDALEIPTVWLVGHLRVQPSAQGEGLVTMSALAQGMALARVPVVAVNPVTREIGTLLSPWSPDAPWDGRGRVARLSVDPLSACVFDARRGLITPSMVRAREAMAKRQAEAERQRRAEAERLEAERYRMATERQRRGVRQDLLTGVRDRRAAAWQRSEVRGIVLAEFGRVPAILSHEVGDEPSIKALPVHWRSIIHVEFISPGPLTLLAHGDEVGPFTIADILGTLKRHRIMNDGAPVAPIMHWLDFLQSRSVVAIHGGPRWRDRSFEATGYSLAKADDEWSALVRQQRDYQARVATRTDQHPTRRRGTWAPGNRET